MVTWCNLSRKRNSKQPDGFDRFQLHPTPHYQSIRTIQKIHNSIQKFRLTFPRICFANIFANIYRYILMWRSHFLANISSLPPWLNISSKYFCRKISVIDFFRKSFVMVIYYLNPDIWHQRLPLVKCSWRSKINCKRQLQGKNIQKLCFHFLDQVWYEILTIGIL